MHDYWDWSLDLGGRTSPILSPGTGDCFVWFVPSWANVWGGGHYTLFRFANHFAKKGTRQIIYTYNKAGRSADALKAELNAAVPNCQLEVVTDIQLLPECSIAFATTWQSAYFVKAFPFAKSKFYFMQDFESNFYAHGTASMQANNTYTFGFPAIAGGNWNRAMYESFGGRAEHYVFSTDRDIFFPSSKEGKVKEKVSRIFFYGRPSTERRCFELGIASLAKVARSYPDIEIVIAGLDIEDCLPFKATLLGSLSLAKTGDLYRACDIGIAFSGTNLSYLPVELMACGVPVISNRGPHVEWFCRDMVNSVLVDPVPTAVLQAVKMLVEDLEIRQSLVDGGLAEVAQRTWESEMDHIYQYIQRAR
ncbi:glycosyltransferase family 4 protein [Afipia sp. 1NLS2]|uniref:glycosyltransferase family 4 protein n=1 Tax=Afipia sp. 1NLS2 TaxID=666684 RepID=UPI0018DD97C4|nr:glycosyltransferase family 4 protein [Afipia sp. 1NLS2]